MSATTISPGSLGATRIGAARRRGVAARPPVVRAQQAVVLSFPPAAGELRAAPSRPARRAPVQAVPAQAVPVRLTRRGRLVVRLGGVLLAVVALGAVVALQSGRASAGEAVQTVPVAGYRTVLPGETLWQIAREVAPSSDPRETIARITDLNAMPSSGVRAGQRLAIPVAP